MTTMYTPGEWRRLTQERDQLLEAAKQAYSALHREGRYDPDDVHTLMVVNQAIEEAEGQEKGIRVR